MQRDDLRGLAQPLLDVAAAASIPLVLSELQEQGKVTPGSRVLVVGFGGGLTWGGMLVEFA